jgi:cation diffusion facilitator family transporter
VYAAMAGVKCWSGAAFHSQVLLADGLNNLTDIFLSLAVMVGLRIAAVPADHNHPFGHRKAETVASLLVACLMGVAALEIGIRALQSLWMGGTEPALPYGWMVPLASCLVMAGLSLINFRLSRKWKSEALRAAAFDNLSDVLVSFAALAGTAGAALGWEWLDPVAAVAVAVLVFRTAWGIGRPAVDILMDGIDGDQLSAIEKRAQSVSGIRQVKEVRARRTGPSLHVEMTVGVDPHLSVRESHRLTEIVEEKLLGYHGIERVHIHVEPHA